MADRTVLVRFTVDELEGDADFAVTEMVAGLVGRSILGAADGGHYRAHLAAAEVVPDPWEALDEIHHGMSIPHDWSADTPEVVAEVLVRLGYTFPYRDEVAVLEETYPVPPEALAPWRPDRG